MWMSAVQYRKTAKQCGLLQVGVDQIGLLMVGEG